MALSAIVSLHNVSYIVSWMFASQSLNRNWVGFGKEGKRESMSAHLRSLFVDLPLRLHSTSSLPPFSDLGIIEHGQSWQPGASERTGHVVVRSGSCMGLAPRRLLRAVPEHDGMGAAAVDARRGEEGEGGRK